MLKIISILFLLFTPKLNAEIKFINTSDYSSTKEYQNAIEEYSKQGFKIVDHDSFKYILEKPDTPNAECKLKKKIATSERKINNIKKEPIKDKKIIDIKYIGFSDLNLAKKDWQEDLNNRAKDLLNNNYVPYQLTGGSGVYVQSFIKYQ
jgi:hypothetical protein